MLTDIATILRKANRTVVEEPSWKTRGHGAMSSVKDIIIHHTADRATGEYPSLRIVQDGRTGLSSPISQLGLGSSAKWYVIAAGKAYHAGNNKGDSIFGNSNVIGIEVESKGTSADDLGQTHWLEVQWKSYVQDVKALQATYGIPTSCVIGHREAAVPASRKIDSNSSMIEFRAVLNNTLLSTRNQVEANQPVKNNPAFTISNFPRLDHLFPANTLTANDNHVDTIGMFEKLRETMIEEGKKTRESFDQLKEEMPQRNNAYEQELSNLKSQVAMLYNQLAQHDLVQQETMILITSIIQVIKSGMKKK
ncbi:unnamed protein product, partial [Rotaria magnacalcarata]